MKIKIDGVILILTCHKYLDTRLKKFKLPKDNYGNWKVIYVIGDLFIDSDYKLEGNLMTIKCEDSYFHLLKKLVLALKYLYEIYDIKDGVLRSGDDLAFNEELLQSFLDAPKQYKIKNNIGEIDFLGNCSTGKSLFEHDFKKYEKKSSTSFHFIYYYKDHPEDFDNPLHNLKDVDISKYTKHPSTPVFIHGPILYLSNKSCKILINHMNNINYNILHYDEKTDSYPYTTEDLAIAYILYYNGIDFIHCNNMYCNTDHTFNRNSMAIHTNMYR